jgi:hypothetical protein
VGNDLTSVPLRHCDVIGRILTGPWCETIFRTAKTQVLECTRTASSLPTSRVDVTRLNGSYISAL